MPIAYVGGNANFSATSPLTLALPALSGGETVTVYGSVFSNNSPITLAGMANPGTLRQMYFGFNGVNDSFEAWAFTAAPSDSGANLTFSSANTFIAGIFQAYSGAGLPPANTGGSNTGYAYANGGFNNAAQPTWGAPAVTGGSPAAGCWGVYFITAGVGSGDGTAAYASGVQRTQNSASGANGWDSNGSLGNAGSAVGGGLWTTQFSGENVGITLALPPPAAPAAAGGPQQGDSERGRLVRKAILW